LAACGTLADSLLCHYQKFGLPKQKYQPYLLWRLFGYLLFIPAWMIIAFNVISLLAGMGAFYVSRKNRLRIEKSQRVRLSGLKLLLIFVITIIFFQLGEAVLQFFKGLRYPWFTHLYEYLWYGAIWLVAGLWLALQLTKKWRFSQDPDVYAKRALLVLFFVTAILMVIAFNRLAFYPSFSLMLFSLAVLIPNRLMKTILVLASPLPLLRLMFDEIIPMKAHFSINLGYSLDNFIKASFYSGLLAGLMILWYLPFCYAFSYLIMSVPPIKSAAKFFRKPIFAVLIGIVILGYGGYLYSLPAYNKMWRPTVRAEAEYDIQKNKSKLKLVGNEYFKDVIVKTDSLDKYFSGRTHKEKLSHSFVADWLTLTGSEAVIDTLADTMNVQVNWSLISQRPWYLVDFQIRLDTLEFDNVQSSLNFYSDNKCINFSWAAEPAESLTVEAQFSITKGSKLIRRVEAYYPEMPIAIEVSSKLANIRYRTQVIYQDTVAVAKNISVNLMKKNN